MFLTIPLEGETSIKDVREALATHGMKLVLDNKRFLNHKGARSKGGPALNLMQETHCCLVITIKIIDLDEKYTWNHFVAWDGKVIYDSPHNCKVNLKSDRTKKGNKAVFKKLFSEKEFSSRDICAIYKLQRCPPSNS